MIYDAQMIWVMTIFKLTNYMLPLTEIKKDKKFSKQLSFGKVLSTVSRIYNEWIANEAPI